MLTIDKIAEHSYVRDWLGPAPVIVDLGANTGRFALAAISRYNARVYAAEAQPDLYESLADLRNPALKVKHVAIAGKNGELVLNVYADRCASTGPQLTTGESSRAVIVPAQTLGDFLNESGVTSVDLLKVDIEGSELEVLAEVSDAVLLSARQITVEFHEFLYPETHAAIEAVKNRLKKLKFYVMDFSLMNGDVLFVNPAIRISKWALLYMHAVKYRAGILRILARRRGAILG